MSFSYYVSIRWWYMKLDCPNHILLILGYNNKIERKTGYYIWGLPWLMEMLVFFVFFSLSDFLVSTNMRVRQQFSWNSNPFLVVLTRYNLMAGGVFFFFFDVYHTALFHVVVGICLLCEIMPALCLVKIKSKRLVWG